MSTKTRIALSVAIILGAAGAAMAAGQHAPPRQGGPAAVERQARSGVDESLGLLPPLDQSMRTTAVYFDPNPTPFKAFTYSASVQLGPSTSKRGLRGEFRFPAFSAAPNVSVQIISAAAAPPMQVSAVKIAEIVRASGLVETEVVVEAETIFDGPARGIFFANIVLIGIPVTPPGEAEAGSGPIQERGGGSEKAFARTR